MINNKYRISFDIGGVISKYDQLIKSMIGSFKSTPHYFEVFILTDMRGKEKVQQLLQDNGLYFDLDHILNADYATHQEKCKAVLIDQYQIDIHIDDHLGYLAASKCLGLLVCPNAEMKYYHDNWKQDNSQI